MRKYPVIIFCTLLLAACTMPETKTYSLYLPAEKRTTDTNANTSIAITVNSPRYLNQPYIARRRSPYELEISKYSKWDSSPVEIMKEAFRNSIHSTGLFREVRISSVMPSDFYVLKIRLRHFEMSDEGDDSFGEIAFEAFLSSPDGKELFHDNFSKKTRLADKDFLGLAKALSNTFDEELRTVRDNIVRSISNSK